MKKLLEKAHWLSVLYATPVVLVSTKSPTGVDNVSPYGMCMGVSFDPPLYVIGVHPSRDTYGYIKERQEFGINLLTPQMKDKCVTTAKGIPANESEFDLAGLDRFQGKEIDVSLVKESPVNFECKLHWMKKAGDHDVVVGEVVATWVNEALYDDNNEIMRMNFDNLFHIGGKYFRRGELV